jgi:UDP:flavonoid glycosyltransferase YjiC (YdhE family)
VKRILFVAEDVTMAQVVRLVVLARALDPARYEIHFACRHFDDLVFRPGEFRRWRIDSVERSQVQKALERGKRLYDLSTLRRYAKSDLDVIDKVQPDLIVGDFRLSLVASAPAARVPLVALINAYWSPHAVRQTFPLPDHPIIKLVGEKTATRYFPQAMPKVFAHFAKPVNELRKHYGLPAVGSLLEVLTHADFTIFPDVPCLTPIRDLPPTQRYIGPVLWAPDVPLPPWWNDLPDDVPLVYVTLGSSGQVRALAAVLEALARLPLCAVVATAGRIAAGDLPGNVRAAEFVPGDQVARRAAVVICNGGSTTGYQALAEGKPIVGIASNLDQHLAINAIEERGAGIRIRAGGVRADTVREAVDTLLGSRSHQDQARALAAEFARWDSAALFTALVDEVTGAGSPAGAGSARTVEQA